MNSTTANKEIDNRQNKLPLWFVVLFAAALLLFLSSLAAYFYQLKERKSAVKVQQVELVAQKESLLQEGDVINTNWLRTLNEQMKNLQGGVIWSSKKQQGVMYFQHLPRTEKLQQYRLWIYDLATNANKRVSAALFHHRSNGDEEYIINMTPEKAVELPYKFELVLEELGEDKQVIKVHPLLLAQP